MAVLTHEIVEGAQDGNSVSDLMARGKHILSANEVLPGVPEMIDEVRVEATFPDGTKLVTIHNPIPSDGSIVPGELLLDDTDLVLEVELDHAVYGDEITFGGGKVIRDGMGQSARSNEVLDLVIINALIVDHWGTVKDDIGIRDGRIVVVGKAGDPAD